MDKYILWEIVSYSWSEIGIDDRERRDLAAKGGINPETLAEVDRIIFKDIAPAFAYESLCIIPPLWVFLPDWGFSEEYLRKKMEKWYSRPYAVNWLNPLRILAYPISLLFVLGARYKLRKAVYANARA